MDINSMLSPQESPRTTNAPPPRLPMTHQTSTAGMDTLADLASMQHHQQTARMNAGSLRSTDVYDTSKPTSAAIIPPSSTVSRLQEPTRRRGRSLDVAMVDGLTDRASPKRKTYSTDALSITELEVLIQLNTDLATSPFSYASHVQLINLLRQGLQNHLRSYGSPDGFNLLSDLSEARKEMHKRFALGEELWVEWLSDHIMLARSLEDCIAVMELCQKAVEEEPSSTKLWETFGQLMLSLYKSANPQEDERVSDIEPMNTYLAWSDEDKEVGRELFKWDQVLAVWQRGSKETAWRLNDSHLLWDTYTKLLRRELALSQPSHEATAQIQNHIVSRLLIPHMTWNETFNMYSNFVSKYDEKNYENTMVAANQLREGAVSKCSAREALESSVLRASDMGGKEAELQAYFTYLEWELSQSRRKGLYDFNLATALYQRATLRFPTSTELWEGYVMFLIEEKAYVSQDASAFTILQRATRHCPWSGTLWSQYMLAAENEHSSFIEVEDIKHKATSSGLVDAGGMEEVLKVQSAWCGFLRRRAFDEGSTDEDMDVAEVGIRSAIENMETLGKEKYGKAYQGDPEYRLEKIYIKYLSQSAKWDDARAEYERLVGRKGNDYNFWFRYYLWEMGIWARLRYSEDRSNGQRSSKPRAATKVLARAIARPKLDWPEKLIEIYQYHCEDNEDAEQLQISVARIWKTRRTVQKRRDKETHEAYEAAQADLTRQQPMVQQDLMADDGDGVAVGKRKREPDAEPITSKKIRSNIPEEEESQIEEQHLSASSLPKRDRENAIISVKNLPKGTLDTKLRQYFRDCGQINSLRIIPETDGDSATAAIEFNAKEDLLTALTKDQKNFEGRTITVQVSAGSTLYVCNFPPTADEAWVRERFAKYGEIVDIRFPSLKYKTHRRFCYVQYKSSGEAQEATQLDGEDFGGNLRLVAKISDPDHKQDRHGPMYEGRELFLANLDWQATKAEVKEAFSKYGTVADVRIITKVDGQSKGIGFVVFSNKNEAMAALEMNLQKFKNRILNVAVSTNDKDKRQATRIITNDSQHSTASPTPGAENVHTKGVSPAPSNEKATKAAEIQSRTIALLNIPDTVNEARIRALAEPYGDLVKVSLRLDHQGVILEYKNVASVGKASLGLDGQEILPGREIRVGTVSEMKQQKAEYRSDKILVGEGAKRVAASLQGAPVKRPTQNRAKRGGKGGLGFKKAGKDADVMENGQHKGAAKSNADFKAMFLKKEA